jgi:hypothetical protein
MHYGIKCLWLPFYSKEVMSSNSNKLNQSTCLLANKPMSEANVLKINGKSKTIEKVCLVKKIIKMRMFKVNQDTICTQQHKLNNILFKVWLTYFFSSCKSIPNQILNQMIKELKHLSLASHYVMLMKIYMFIFEANQINIENQLSCRVQLFMVASSLFNVRVFSYGLQAPLNLVCDPINKLWYHIRYLY